MKKSIFNQKRRGFLLLEVVLAMGVFAAVAVGFTMALNRAADASDLASKNVQVTRILHSAMEEALSLPLMEERRYEVEIEEREMTIVTELEPILEDLQNKDGQILQDMWRITVTAYYMENEANMERSAVTWRYGRLYQP